MRSRFKLHRSEKLSPKVNYSIGQLHTRLLTWESVDDHVKGEPRVTGDASEWVWRRISTTHLQLVLLSQNEYMHVRGDVYTFFFFTYRISEVRMRAYAREAFYYPCWLHISLPPVHLLRLMLERVICLPLTVRKYLACRSPKKVSHGGRRQSRSVEHN
jgi:hypothetical protein